MVKARSEVRATARADRKCEHCGEPITAQRSTMRFCSVRCRVADHRNANGWRNAGYPESRRRQRKRLI